MTKMHISVIEHPKHKIDCSEIEDAISQEWPLHHRERFDKTYTPSYDCSAKNTGPYDQRNFF